MFSHSSNVETDISSSLLWIRATKSLSKIDLSPLHLFEMDSDMLPLGLVVKLCSDADPAYIRTLPCDVDTVDILDCNVDAVTALPPHMLIANIDDMAIPLTIANLPPHIKILGRCYLSTLEAARAIPDHITGIKHLVCENWQVFDALPNRIKKTLSSAKCIIPGVLQRRLATESAFYFRKYNHIITSIHKAFKQDYLTNGLSELYELFATLYGDIIAGKKTAVSIPGIKEFFFKLHHVRDFFSNVRSNEEAYKLIKLYMKHNANPEKFMLQLSPRKGGVSEQGVFATSTHEILQERIQRRRMRSMSTPVTTAKSPKKD